MRKPTIKQKAAVKNIIENHGNISKGMRDAGYTEATAKNPKNLTKSQVWEQLLEEHLPDELLRGVLEDGLKADKVISAVIVGSKANENTNDFIEVPDHPTRHKYLDTALKLKKKYPAEKTILAGDPDEPLQIEIIEEKHG